MGWPITCPECDGNKGHFDPPPSFVGAGRWVECEVCDGDGWVDEDELEDDDD